MLQGRRARPLAPLVAISDYAGVDVIVTVEAGKHLDAMPEADAKRIRAALAQVADAYPQRLGL